MYPKKISTRNITLCYLTAIATLLPSTNLLQGNPDLNPKIIYVSTHGNDDWSGELEKPKRANTDGPLKTIHAAVEVIRQLKEEQGGLLRHPIEVRVQPGTYALEKPITCTPEDSGTESCPITFKAWGNGKSILSGGRVVEKWERTDINGRKAWVADLPWAENLEWLFQQLWVNNQRAIQARSPNNGYLKVESIINPEGVEASSRTGTYQFKFKEQDASHWQDVQEGTAVMFNRWMEYHMPLAKVDATSRMIECSKPSIWQLDAGDQYYIEGDISLLDEPGEWFFDQNRKKLYYLPRRGEKTIKAVIPVLKHAIRLEGRPRQGEYVEHLRFEGFTVSHTSWPMHPEESGYRQSSIGVGGAIYATAAKDCTIVDCDITRIGNYAIHLDTGCHDNRILRCQLQDLGAGGILIGSNNRGRSFKYAKDKKEVRPVLDHPEDATSGNEVSDCRIHGGGKYYHCAIGIWIGQSPDNWIHHNEIYDFYYSGMSIGWTWGYGPGLAQRNRVEYNHFHHIGQLSNGDGPVLSDMAGIYTLGDQTGTLIQNNIIHNVKSAKYGGWGLYFDEGTRHLIAKNNLIYDTMHGCFNQHYGRENMVTNNILAFSGAGVVSLGRGDEQINFTLTRNILVADNGPLFFGGYGYHPGKDRAIASDFNLVWDLSGNIIAGQNRQSSRFYERGKPVVSWEQWQALGHDTRSIVADPGFRNLGKRDFRFKDPAKAREIGFYPFDLNDVGPRD